MHRVLFTGMSGTGKSTMLAAMKTADNLVLDLDYDGWIAPDDSGEPLLDIPRLMQFFADHPAQDIFLAGTVCNQWQLYPHLTAVITLTAPLPVMQQRILSRRHNPFGQWPGEWEQIVQDKLLIEPLLIRRSDFVCDTDRDWAEAVQSVRDFLARG